MAIRLGEYLEWGYLYHSRRNSTHGHLKLRGMETPLMFELTGDPAPELIGKALRFEPSLREGEPVEELPDQFQNLYNRQIGPTGLITIERSVRVLPPDFVYGRDSARTPDGKLIGEWKRCLAIEWYGQNGRVFIELADPILGIADYSDVRGKDDDDDIWQTPADRESWEPEEFEAAAEMKAEEPVLEGLSDESDDGWYPGKDRRDEREMTSEEYIAEMELMDDLVCGDREGGQSLCSVISESVPSGPLDQLTDEEAESALKIALAQLALRCVAVHVCEHFSARDSLNFLRTVAADDDEFYPELIPTGFTQNFATCEFCPQCDAEMEKDFEEYEANRREQGDSDDELGEPPF